MCNAPTRVRFASDSDRESGHPQEFMSALPPKADMCSAKAHVCFGPKADIALVTAFTITRPLTKAASIVHGFAQTRTI
jgi:hypothetical protein